MAWPRKKPSPGVLLVLIFLAGLALRLIQLGTSFRSADEAPWRPHPQVSGPPDVPRILRPARNLLAGGSARFLLT
jgi:hypothetical protein